MHETSHWRVAVLILSTAWIVTIGLFWTTAISMPTVWSQSGTFAHGYFIGPVAAGLVWARRRQLSELEPAVNPWGLPLLTVVAFGWLVGRVADVLVLQQLALVAMLQLLVWIVLGTPVVRALLFPLAFLLFAVPIGEFLIEPLQDFTAWFAAGALRLSGIPVFWEGRLLVIPTGSWRMAKACSGIRYVIPAVALGCLYAALTYRSWRRRLSFVVASAIVPVLANGLRASGIILLAHLTENRIAIGVDHLLYGWLFFGVVMLLLFWAGARWRERIPSRRRGPAAARRSSARTMAMTAAMAMVLLALAPVSLGVWFTPSAAPAALRARLPSVAPPWREEAADGDWKPRFTGVTAQVMRRYVAGSHGVDLFMAYYASEQQGAELISSENDLVDGQRWVRTAERGADAIVDGNPARVRETIISSTTNRTRLVWSWYWVADEFTASAYRAKLLRVKARLLGAPSGAAVIAVATPHAGGRAEAAGILQDFLSHSPSLRTTLRGFRQ